MKPVTTTVLRQATRADIPGIWTVRYAVQENTLRRGVISDDDVRVAIEDTGRGWVVCEAGTGTQERILAFAIGNAQDGNIWALFVLPEAQGQGLGSQLYDVMLAWLQQQGQRALWLTTGPGTRALGFYERRGWRLCAQQDDDDEDLRLELRLSE